MWFGWDKSTCSGSTMEAAQTSDGRAATGAPATGSQPKNVAAPPTPRHRLVLDLQQTGPWGRLGLGTKKRLGGLGYGPAGVAAVIVGT